MRGLTHLTPEQTEVLVESELASMEAAMLADGVQAEVLEDPDTVFELDYDGEELKAGARAKLRLKAGARDRERAQKLAHGREETAKAGARGLLAGARDSLKAGARGLALAATTALRRAGRRWGRRRYK